MGSFRTLSISFAASLLAVTLVQANALAAPPSGVPNFTDPTVLSRFVPRTVSNLAGDPDFPSVLLTRRGEGTPQYVLVIVDARNGKETWSIREDAAVFYALFADRETIHQAFLDAGFAAQGQPSGRFLAARPERVEELVGRLGEDYLRARGIAGTGAIL